MQWCKYRIFVDLNCSHCHNKEDVLLWAGLKENQILLQVKQYAVLNTCMFTMPMDQIWDNTMGMAQAQLLPVITVNVNEK